MTDLRPRPLTRGDPYAGRTHRPVCSSCGDPWPCDGYHEETDAAREAHRRRERMRLLSSLDPARDCLGCGTPITTRQRVLVYEGPNVWLPGVDGARFHDRRDCDHYAVAYEIAWRRAWPTRPGKVMCGGRLTHHEDRFECTSKACPVVGGRSWRRVRHSSYQRCMTPECCSWSSLILDERGAVLGTRE